MGKKKPEVSKLKNRRGKGFYAKDGRIYFKVKVDGKWVNVRTEFRVGQEREAAAMRAKLDESIELSNEAESFGPLTVARWYEKRWLAERKGVVPSWRNDEANMRLWVLPAIGDMRFEQVRPRHVVAIVRSVRAQRAPRTVYNVYATVSAFFRDAALEDLIPDGANPCILDAHQLGPKMDANPEWRPTAIYSRSELERLISDESIPWDRRVVYALQGIGALRHGEMAKLRWMHLLDAEPLIQLAIVRPKSSLRNAIPARYMPVHPTLAAILSEWRLHGWVATFGRQPSPEDLVVPLPDFGNRIADPSRKMRDMNGSLRRLKWDLETLGMRVRRGHDLRRTMISLARSDGAQVDILRRGTHKPPKEVIEGYTTFEWDVLCREVAKLKVHRRQHSKITALTKAANGSEDEFATMFATTKGEPMEIVAELAARDAGVEPARRGHDASRLVTVAESSHDKSRTYVGPERRLKPGKSRSVTDSRSKVANSVVLTRQQVDRIRAALQTFDSGLVAAALEILDEVER